jgi:hypothetical protein
MTLDFKSACTVATVEVVREAHAAILCLRAHYPGVPVYVIADRRAAVYFKEARLNDVMVREVDFTKPATVAEQNTFHRPDAISRKMDAMEWAMDLHGDTLFFDADFLLLAPLNGHGPHDADVWVSHNLSETPDAAFTASKFGMFNAGLVWSRDPKFPGWWRDRYVTHGGFYEQSAMNKIPGAWTTAYFDLAHNQGFWRGGKPQRTHPKSWHVHLDHTRIDQRLTDYMRPRVQAFRPHAWRALAGRMAGVHLQVRAALDHPRRVLFAHYGKAGGIYTNAALKFAFHGYLVKDSWGEKLGRDWTEDELRAIIDDSPEFTYVHQHHHGISQENMERALASGWDVISFYREPADLVCSLYFWAQKTVRDQGVNHVMAGEDPEGKFTFAEFWDRIMQPDKHYQWRRPSWWDLVQHKDLFSPANLDRVLLRLVGYPHIPAAPKNVSGNPGPAALLRQGVLTQSMLGTLKDVDAADGGFYTGVHEHRTS